jgi:hypothetical protein
LLLLQFSVTTTSWKEPWETQMASGCVAGISDRWQALLCTGIVEIRFQQPQNEDISQHENDHPYMEGTLRGKIWNGDLEKKI